MSEPRLHDDRWNVNDDRKRDAATFHGRFDSKRENAHVLLLYSYILRILLNVWRWPVWPLAVDILVPKPFHNILHHSPFSSTTDPHRAVATLQTIRYDCYYHSSSLSNAVFLDSLSVENWETKLAHVSTWKKRGKGLGGGREDSNIGHCAHGVLDSAHNFWIPNNVLQFRPKKTRWKSGNKRSNTLNNWHQHSYCRRNHSGALKPLPFPSHFWQLFSGQLHRFKTERFDLMKRWDWADHVTEMEASCFLLLQPSSPFGRLTGGLFRLSWKRMKSGSRVIRVHHFFFSNFGAMHEKCSSPRQDSNSSSSSSSNNNNKMFICIMKKKLRKKIKRNTHSQRGSVM